MSPSPGQPDLAEQYLQRIGARAGGAIALSSSEVAWLLHHAARWGALRLALLTALQKALPRPRDDAEHGGPAGQLKETLTNLIIMQSRVNEREGALMHLLDAAMRDGTLAQVPVDTEEARRVAEALVEASQHLHGHD